MLLVVRLKIPCQLECMTPRFLDPTSRKGAGYGSPHAFRVQRPLVPASSSVTRVDETRQTESAVG